MFFPHLTFDLATMALTLVNLDRLFLWKIYLKGFSNFITMVTKEGCCAWAYLVKYGPPLLRDSGLELVTHVSPLTRALEIYMLGYSNFVDMSI